MTRALLAGSGLVAALALAACAEEGAAPQARAEAAAPVAGAAAFRIDPAWPKDLPNKWLIGMVIGVATDSRDHVWVLQRPGSLTASEAGAAANPPTSDCCVPAPPVLVFDQEGNLVQSWGGPGAGYEWPASEHGIFVDFKDNVWIGGNSDKDGQVLKFTRDGRFLLQIGRAGKRGGSNDTTILGGPADIGVDPATNEVYVADGYLNRRVIVFDADTGAYKRHWGGYGKPPDDRPLDPYKPGDASPIFGDTVHCVVIEGDLVYVCDRMNHRVQVFQKDGTFVKEGFIARDLPGASAWDVDFSRDAGRTEVYEADGGNHRVWILGREALDTKGSIGRRGRNAGQFESPHSVAVDSRGNVYVGETLGGRRIQRFLRSGAATTN